MSAAVSPAVPVTTPSPWQQVKERLLEVLPGLTTWTMLLAPAWIPLVFASDGALVVAVAILLFDLYWFYRSFHLLFNVWGTFKHLERDMNTDWLTRCRETVDADLPDPLAYYHLCIVPTYTEPYRVLERTVQAIVDANYPRQLKIVGIITRETDKKGWANVAKLREKFADQLGGFYHIKDPLEPPLVPGKSAAMNWGGRYMVKQLTAEGYDLRRILVTDLDSDYKVHPQYFAWLSFHHARQKNREYVIWQPVPLFHNNIWEVPLAVRVMSASAHQWQMFLHSQRHRLLPFSSYTCSLQFVHDVGYWDKDVIPEDSRFYWKSFFTFGERLEIKPCYLPIYGDSPQSPDYASTLQNQYSQIKRWAWGITDIPYVLKRIFKYEHIPLGLRLRKFSNLFLIHLNWIFLPILLMFGTSMPIWASLDFALTDLGQTLWIYSTIILSAALGTVLVLAYIEHRMLPPKPESWGPWRRRLVYLQFATYPIVGLIFSVLPALESHTRLLLGKYLEYRVTEKV
jgi:cellulose synthase/poly-beta-1,6-N-acetylglucosamine synthase-like glycosyltransferase